jgi:histidinol dehydrogenase
MSPPARVLVVANRTADSEEVHAALVERAEHGPIEVTLVAPATWEIVDPHGGRQSAARRLNAALTRLAAAGIAARGVVGDADPVTAVRDIWDAKRFDEVIVATLPQHRSRWLSLDLPHRVEQLTGRPTRHVVASERAGVAR